MNREFPPAETVTVLISADEPGFVHHAVAELEATLQELTGSARVVQHEAEVQCAADSVTIVVGQTMAGRVLPDFDVELAAPGPESFVVRSMRLPDGGRAIVAAGYDSPGTNYAVMHLRRLLLDAPTFTGLPTEIDVRERPAYPLRGLYLHQHWRYNHPYATWSWSVGDWKRAIDMLACMRINLVMIWAHVDMMATPLTVDEFDYLARLREVIDYAHQARGMKVWLVEPSNVLLDQPEVRRTPLEARDYYAYAHMAGGGLKNPADTSDRAALLANRESLYCCVPNADGYGYIDSDPGGWLDSPSEEFVDLLSANRELLNRLHDSPSETVLFHWVLAGWGTGTCAENWRDTMSGVAARVGAPRAFLACFAPQVEIARELGHLPQTLLFPYGIIDGEPSFPLTALRFDQLQLACRFAAGYDGLGGVIGNVQTFLIQLPNIYYLARAVWSGVAPDENDPSVLTDLARQLFPDASALLADAWRELHRTGAAAARETALRIEEAAANPATLAGTLGQYVFPEPTQILTDLAMLLRIHAAAEAVRESFLDSGSGVPAFESIVDYLNCMLESQQRNGFAGARGIDGEIVYDVFMFERDFEMVRAAGASWLQGAGAPLHQAQLEHALADSGADKAVIASMVGQLFGTYAVKIGSIESVIFQQLPPPAETMPWTQISGNDQLEVPQPRK